jgi:hypothetical protein
MNPMLWPILIVVGSAIVLWLLHRLLMWMETRGWIYYRKRNLEGRGSMRSVFSGFEEFVHPVIRHVQDDRDRRAAEDAKSTDPSNR